MTYYVNFFKGEAPLIEESPQGDASVELHLDARAQATLASVCQIASFELSHLLGQVYLAGVREADRSRRVTG